MVLARDEAALGIPLRQIKGEGLLHFGAAIALGMLVSVPEVRSAEQNSTATQFSVSLAPNVVAEANRVSERKASKTLDGRVYVVVSKRNDQEPRLQGPPGMTADSAPIWGKDVSNLAAGSPVRFGQDGAEYGFPMASLKELPPGRYFAQALMNVYETFKRSDGTTVQLHMPCGDGHRIAWSTGNIYSDVQEIEVGAGAAPVALTLSHVIRPLAPTPEGGTCQQGNIPETEHVKFLKVRSDKLSKFWGRPIFVAARVILPAGYNDDPKRRYPVIYGMDHHFRAYEAGGSSQQFWAFSDGADNSFTKWWLSDAAPRAIVVQPLSENPYYDTSYWVNSPNSGPYGDALEDDLIPAIDKRFRTVSSAWARSATGCSSGGWMSLAAQVFHSKLFGGAFIFAPDIVDFRATWLLDIYKDQNAYFNQTEWRRWPRPYSRDAIGNALDDTGAWGHLELAMGAHSRSGEYFDHMEATFGPRGADGYPVTRWNKLTGEIDRQAVEQFRKFDMAEYLTSNWGRLGPELKGGKLKFFVTEEDSYYTNRAVHMLEERLKAVSPESDAEFNYFPTGAHCNYPMTHEELVSKMVSYMEGNRKN